MDQDNKNNEGTDLSGAPKDSGAGVEFKEYRGPRSYYSEMPKIIQWIIKYSGGLVKDEKQANYVLIGFMVVMISISFVLFFKAIRSPAPPQLDEIINVAGPQEEF